MADISYTPTTWADGAEGGTPIDAAKLNNIESGIVDAVAAIGPNDTTEDGTLKAQIDANATAIDDGYSLSSNADVALNSTYSTPARGLLLVGGYSGVVITVSVNNVLMLRFKADTINGGNTFHTIYLPKGASVRITSNLDSNVNTHRFYY